MAPPAKESASDLVLACLGDKSLSGSVSNTRLAVRKNRGGQQGQEYPFHPARRGGAGAGRGRGADHHHGGGLAADCARRKSDRPGPDPWAQGRRQDQRAAVLRLKRVMMGSMAEHGVEREIPPDGPPVLDDRSGGGPRAVLCPDSGGRHAETESWTSGASNSIGRWIGPKPRS